MNNIEKIPNYSELRKFGMISSAVTSILFGLLIPLLFDSNWVLWPWAASAVLALWSFLNPERLIYIYRPWMKFGVIMGWVNSRIILFLIFYLIITPAGLVARLLGARLIEEGLSKEVESYRIIESHPNNNHMEKPY